MFVNSLIYERNRLLHRGGAMTLFFKGVWEFGRLKGTCCGDWVMCHDGEGKVAFGMTGAAPLRPTAPVKKKKARNDVCGATQAIHKLPHSTRQKRKSKK